MMKESKPLSKFSELLNKYRELIVYVICGILTTVVNFAVYTPVSFLMSGVMGSYAVLFADVVSWIVAVLFAFFVNKRFVFKDGIEKENSGNEDRLSARRRTTVQLAEFAGLRIVSLGVELAFHVVFTQVLHLNDIVVKVIASVFVVVSNYIFSKFIIFKNKKIK